MKYTILPGIVRTEVCGETMLIPPSPKSLKKADTCWKNKVTI